MNTVTKAVGNTFRTIERLMRALGADKLTRNQRFHLCRCVMFFPIAFCAMLIDFGSVSVLIKSSVVLLYAGLLFRREP